MTTTGVFEFHHSNISPGIYLLNCHTPEQQIRNDFLNFVLKVFFFFKFLNFANCPLVVRHDPPLGNHDGDVLPPGNEASNLSLHCLDIGVFTGDARPTASDQLLDRH